MPRKPLQELLPAKDQVIPRISEFFESVDEIFKSVSREAATKLPNYDEFLMETDASHGNRDLRRLASILGINLSQRFGLAWKGAITENTGLFGDGSTKVFSFLLSALPAGTGQNDVRVIAGVPEIIFDGTQLRIVISPYADATKTNTVNYQTGDVTVTFLIAPPALTPIQVRFTPIESIKEFERVFLRRAIQTAIPFYKRKGLESAIRIIGFILSIVMEGKEMNFDKELSVPLRYRKFILDQIQKVGPGDGDTTIPPGQQDPNTTFFVRSPHYQIEVDWEASNAIIDYTKVDISELLKDLIITLEAVRPAHVVFRIIFVVFKKLVLWVGVGHLDLIVACFPPIDPLEVTYDFCDYGNFVWQYPPFPTLTYLRVRGTLTRTDFYIDNDKVADISMGGLRVSGSITTNAGSVFPIASWGGAVGINYHAPTKKILLGYKSLPSNLWIPFLSIDFLGNVLMNYDFAESDFAQLVSGKTQLTGDEGDLTFFLSLRPEYPTPLYFRQGTGFASLYGELSEGVTFTSC